MDPENNNTVEGLVARIAALEAKVKSLTLAGNAMSYELQDTDPDVKFDTIKVWKQAVRQ
jgi:hypothetical protein